jgi:phosphatidate phosphatase APP1
VFALAKQFFLFLGRRAEAAFDEARFRLKVKLGRLERIEILAYRGHGNGSEVFLKGRVLEESGVTPSTHTDNVLRNLKNMARRFFSSEIPQAVVRAGFRGEEVEAKADEEGFFDVRFDVREELRRDFEWHPVALELVSPLAPGQGGERSKGWVLAPDEDSADFAVISDIDDTVMLSKAASVLRMALIVAVGNAHSRLAFPGVGALYHALRRGKSGASRNPVFYVSSSPWNIYDLLVDFMDVHDLPPGPIFLKDWSPTVLGKHEDHKLDLIRTLLSTYPRLPFVLLGDSGQEDPEIYARAASENPDRIKAVYIRDVTGEKRAKEVARISAGLLASSGVPMKLVRDSSAAAEHALSLGLVSPESVREVFARIP